ncbi:hypothetical protein NQ317_007693 [Molorchus minor]|uniref:Reverse transcriptase n=1 Tax=Molorchus minor TaxID=1323400 RepID=A0ABQ9JNZ5_9CUCU|nr:hypothetical protein NQ317_007693 [Molorchus minor]
MALQPSQAFVGLPMHMEDLRNMEVNKKPPAIKFLGVYLDSKLTWEEHVIYLSNKLSKNIFLIRSLSKIHMHPKSLKFKGDVSES